VTGRRWAPVALLCLLPLLACSTTSQGRTEENAAAGTPTAEATATQTPQPTATTSAPAAPATATPPTAAPPPEPPHPVSLPALMAKQYDGRDLQVGHLLASNSAYTRYFVTYLSGELRISGIMNVPTGTGPFPVLVLNHGYIDPAVYTNGRGLAREQDFLARRGFVVLHTDYRNHAQSDVDPESDLKLRLGYTEDVINAVLAIKSSSFPYLDQERVGLLGRSMGSGVTYNTLVVAPGLVDAAVVYAPVSSDAVDNFNRWISGSPVGDAIIATYGAPEANPTFWRNVSAVNFFDRITEPILIHHGTADESCPIDWSHRTVAALHQAGKKAELVTYESEPHAFEAAWPASMERTVAFFQQHLR
jgi:dipeptidyl aminopeptidase/acylaminoacyl peptidase